jgi:biotin carboxyl carrier protein
VVAAPLLPVFYRRHAPDQPPLAETGQRVEVGKALGLPEAMETYHEATAPRAGVVAAFPSRAGRPSRAWSLRHDRAAAEAHALYHIW